MERLSPMGVDVKSLRRETKRGFGLTLAGAADMKMEFMESPHKKPTFEQPRPVPPSKPGKPGKTSLSTSANNAAMAKRKAVSHSEVAALQDVVQGIQRQVDEASRGIQELKQLVDSHLVTKRFHQPEEVVPMAPMLPCVSPPASFLTLDQEEEELGELVEFQPPLPSVRLQDCATMGDMMLFYSGTPMPFSC